MEKRFLAGHLQEVVLALCEDLATPLSLSVAILVRSSEWDQLATKVIGPEHYLDTISGAHRFRKDAAAVSFLKKFQALPAFSEEILAQKAIQTFWDCERSCFRANERLSPIIFGGHTDLDLPVVEYLHNVRKRVGRILGKPPKLQSFEGDLEGGFGPGATYSDRSRNALVPDKITNRPTLTKLSTWLLWQWGNTAWARSCAERELSLDYVPGNRFATVPKDATKLRCIAMEPSLNVYYQLAVGRLMKARLRRYGMPDLKTEAQDRHRELARKSSIDGQLATLDLSNASDTVAYNLVKLLLPHQWFVLLDMLRSPKTLVKGHWVVLEKFSSMGNGFTFELETVIFSALVEQVMVNQGIEPLPGVNFSVFGDDIICPTSTVQDVIAALKFCGFSLNIGKSFWQGPFRESCGADFFEGLDSRPIFLKKDLDTPVSFVTLHNRLRHIAPYGSRWQCLRKCLEAIPTSLRGCRGPTWLGDAVIHSSREHWVFRWKHCIREFRAVVSSPQERFCVQLNKHFWPDVVMASALYRAGSNTGVWKLNPRRRGSKLRDVIAEGPYSPIGSSNGDQVALVPRDVPLDYRVAWVAGS